MRVCSIQQTNINSLYLKKKEKINTKKQTGYSGTKDIYPLYYPNISFCGMNVVNSFNSKLYLEKLCYENAEKIYSVSEKSNGITEYHDRILPNFEAAKKLEILDKLTPQQKKQFVEEFCSITGFPDYKTVVQKIENEISTSIHQLAFEEDFDVNFIGYDSNCSVGRKLPIPGSDCDGLFMIIDTKNHKEEWFPGKIRWEFKDYVNQRILSTPANHLPEVLSTDFIEQGLEYAQSAFDEYNFSDADLKRFEAHLNDNSNDFVKSAEFNIKLAQKLPNDISIRERYYKTAMLAEVIRDGVVCENNLDADLYNKILNSSLYKYSNLMKQKGLKPALKSKYIQRQTLSSDFHTMSTEKQFQLIKDILYYSFNKTQDNENKKYFSNAESGKKNAMGNIVEMYDLVLNIPYEPRK